MNTCYLCWKGFLKREASSPMNSSISENLLSNELFYVGQTHIRHTFLYGKNHFPWDVSYGRLSPMNYSLWERSTPMMFSIWGIGSNLEKIISKKSSERKVSRDENWQLRYFPKETILRKEFTELCKRVCFTSFRSHMECYFFRFYIIHFCSIL